MNVLSCSSSFTAAFLPAGVSHSMGALHAADRAAQDTQCARLRHAIARECGQLQLQVHSHLLGSGRLPLDVCRIYSTMIWLERNVHACLRADMGVSVSGAALQ